VVFSCNTSVEAFVCKPKGGKVHALACQGWNKDGVIRHPADATQGRLFDRLYPSFGDDTRNVRVAMSTDGMNLVGRMSSRHITWPMLLCIYNLPPWLCLKKYIIMSMLIQRPKQHGNDIDVYCRLLEEELQTLWKEEGVRVWDAYEKHEFDLRRMLFLTIQDYRALANTPGRSTKGPTTRVTCMDDPASLWLPKSRKTIYMRHRRFLRRNHPYRRMKEQFDGTIDKGATPRPLTYHEVFDKVKDVNVLLGKGQNKHPHEKSVWKEKSVF
jgi:hypothetical protein